MSSQVKKGDLKVGKTTLNMCFNYDASLKQTETRVICLSALKRSSKSDCFVVLLPES